MSALNRPQSDKETTMTTAQQTIGFIGLGNMGGPMAANLLQAGFQVKVFDLVPAAVAAVTGAQACDSAQAAADQVDVVVSMLPAGAHVRSLYLGSPEQPGLMANLAADTLIIDCSTIDPDSARAVAEAASARGLQMLDAPVSGGTAGAENGTLTFIVGGAEDALGRARPILEAMGANIFHAGGAGAGQVAKICNNMLLAVLMAGTAEALALGVENGLDPAVLSNIMKVSSGGNWALNVYNPYPGVMPDVPADRGYSGGFLVDLMRKDLGLALQTAQASASSIPLGSLAHNLYQVHRQTHDAGQLDFSSIQWLFRPELKKD
ncbi:MAG: 3-hydroxyisobutyrate dehydrogenase [Pseudomonadota bacterium]